MSEWDDVRDEVAQRAGSRCEYCRMHQSLQGATFHIEHIIPRSNVGDTVSDNLTLPCPSCNLRKSDQTEVTDFESGQSVPLFHPRKDVWWEHFSWNGYRLAGTTPTGRATISALHLNHERRLRIREAEERFGLFPPDDSLSDDS